MDGWMDGRIYTYIIFVSNPRSEKSMILKE